MKRKPTHVFRYIVLIQGSLDGVWSLEKNIHPPLTSRGKNLYQYLSLLSSTQRVAHVPVYVPPALLGERCQGKLPVTSWCSPDRRACHNGTEPIAPNCVSCSIHHLPIPQIFLLLEIVFSKNCEDIMADCRPWNLGIFMLECKYAHLRRAKLSFVFISVCYFFFFLRRNSIVPVISGFEPLLHSVFVRIKKIKWENKGGCSWKMTAPFLIILFPICLSQVSSVTTGVEALL